MAVVRTSSEVITAKACRDRSAYLCNHGRAGDGGRIYRLRMVPLRLWQSDPQSGSVSDQRRYQRGAGLPLISRTEKVVGNAMKIYNSHFLWKNMRVVFVVNMYKMHWKGLLVLTKNINGMNNV